MKTAKEILGREMTVREENRKKILQRLLIELDKATEIMYMEGSRSYCFDVCSIMDKKYAKWALQTFEVNQFLVSAGLSLNYFEENSTAFLICKDKDDEDEPDEEPDKEPE